MDLADCPGGVADKLDSEAKIGLTLPLTGGPAAAFAVLGPGAAAAIAEGNATAGLDTRFELIQKDDQFMPDKTLTAAQELIQKDGIVGMTGVTGTAGVIAVRDLLKEECLPGISLPGGGSAVNDPAYPMVVQGAVPFRLDTRVWVEHVDETFPAGAKIALFIGNTESGKDYRENIDKWLTETDSPSKIVAEELIDASDATAPSSQITTLRNSGADVLFAAPTGAQCISMMTEMTNQGWKPATYLTTNCASTTYFGPAGAAGDGVYTLQSLKDIGSPRYADDPDVQAVRAALEKYGKGVDLTNTTTYGGYTYAQNFIEAAQIAAKSDLGLSKLGLIHAGRHMNYHPKMFVDGVDFITDGDKDLWPIEAGELNNWDAAVGTFEPVRLYDFEGQLTE